MCVWPYDAKREAVDASAAPLHEKSLKLGSASMSWFEHNSFQDEVAFISSESSPASGGAAAAAAPPAAGRPLPLRVPCVLQVTVLNEGSLGRGAKATLHVHASPDSVPETAFRLIEAGRVSAKQRQAAAERRGFVPVLRSALSAYPPAPCALQER